MVLDCNGDDGDTPGMELGDEDGSLIVGLSEILSGRPPIFTLRTRCPAQAYCLSGDDVRSIFSMARSPDGGATIAGGSASMRLVAQATAVHMHRRVLYLTAQWKRVVHRVYSAAAAAGIGGLGESKDMAAADEGKEASARRTTSCTRVQAAVGRLFEDGMWSPRQEDGGGKGC